MTEGMSLVIITPSGIGSMAPTVRQTCHTRVPIVLFSEGMGASRCATSVNNSGMRTNERMTHFLIEGLSKGNAIIRVANLGSTSPIVRHRHNFRRIVGGCPKVGIIALSDG